MTTENIIPASADQIAATSKGPESSPLGIKSSDTALADTPSLAATNSHPSARAGRVKSAFGALGDQASVLGLFIAAMAGIYSSSLLLIYGFNDDYGLLDQVKNFRNKVFKGDAVQGRPLTGWALQWGFRHAGTLRNLCWMRAVGVLGVAFAAMALHWVLLRAGWNRLTAICVAIIFCTVPAVQVYATWANFMPTPWGLFAAVLAGLLVGWIVDGGGWRYALTPIAPALLLASVTIYQPGAMVFTAVMLTDAFSPRRREERPWAVIGRLLFFQIINGIALFGGFEVFHWEMRRYPKTMIPGRTGFAHDLLQKPAWFVQYPLTDALNLWNIQATTQVAIAVAAVIAVGLMLYFPGNWRRRLLYLLICAIALPAAHIPNILAERSDSYRTQIGLSWTILTLSLLSVTGIWHGAAGLFRIMARSRDRVDGFAGVAQPMPGALLVLAAAAAAGSAAYTCTMFIVWPHALELAVLRMQLAKPNVASAHHLIFLQLTRWDDTSAPYSISDEFGYPTIANMLDWVPTGAVFALDRETNRQAPHRDIQMIPNFVGEYTAPLPPDTAVIDMRRLDAAR